MESEVAFDSEYVSPGAWCSTAWMPGSSRRACARPSATWTRRRLHVLFYKMHVCISCMFSLSLSLYIYIYIERERDTYIYIYICYTSTRIHARRGRGDRGVPRRAARLDSDKMIRATNDRSVAMITKLSLLLLLVVVVVVINCFMSIGILLTSTILLYYTITSLLHILSYNIISCYVMLYMCCIKTML